MLADYFELIIPTVMLTFFCLYIAWISFDSEWYGLFFSLIFVIIVFDIYIALCIKSSYKEQKDLFNAVNSGYEVYINGQKSDIDFTSDFIIDNYVFTIDDMNHYISCTNKH